MTGFAGRILIEGNRGEAEALLPSAIKLAETLRAWKETQRLPAVTKSYDLGDGRYCVIADLQHMRAIQIVVPPSLPKRNEEELYGERTTDTGVHDVLSGRVTSPTIIQEQINPAEIGKSGDEPALQPLLRSFVSCAYSATRYTDKQRRYRLAIPEDPVFAPINTDPNIVYSEHAHAVPSNYSGAMRKVVQFLLGLGKTIRPTWEEKWMQSTGALPMFSKQIENRQAAYQIPTSAFGLYEGPSEVKTVLQYDYRFAKTHGIAFDEEGVAWVIEISARGVYAMRLYLDAVSKDKVGRKRYIDVNPELESFIDEFGGIPIGVGYPRANNFEKWKKAGEVVELLSRNEIAEFYSKSLFSSVIGWSFNKKGTEAHNVAVGLSGIYQTGNHYRIRIKLQNEKFPELGEAHKKVMAILPLTEFWQANKVRRLTESQAASLISTYEHSNGDPTAAMEEFLDLAVDPTLKGSADISLVNSGILYSPLKPKHQPQIKFPEPMMGGLISFDFGKVDFGARLDYASGPVFVCHIDDELDVLTYTFDGRPRVTPASEYTRQPCQYGGQWKYRTFGGDPFLAGNFHSNRWDLRKEIVPSVSETEYEGNPIGVYSVAAAAGFFSTCIEISSYTAFRINSTATSKAGIGMRLAVAIPFNYRDCYYMATHDSVSEVNTIIGAGNENAEGSVVYTYVLYNFVFHWFGSCNSYGRPKSPTCVAQFAGSYGRPSCVPSAPMGISYSVCPSIVFSGTPIVVSNSFGGGVLGSAIYPPTPPPSGYSEVIRVSDREQACEIRMICDSGYGTIITKHDSVSGDDPGGLGGKVDFYSLNMSEWWFKASPDPDSGAMPWMGATASCLGNPVLNYHIDMNGNEVAHKGGPELMHGDVRHCYTGVIK